MRKKRKVKEQEGTGEPVPPERPAGESRRITPVEIQQVEFRRSLRGYNEREVDQFLDDVTEEMARLYAESKRRREEVEFKGTASLSTGPAAEAGTLMLPLGEAVALGVLATSPGLWGDLIAGGQLTRDQAIDLVWCFLAVNAFGDETVPSPTTAARRPRRVAKTA